MKHVHHIVPKYLGGSDSKDNLIELSVEDHAEAHRLLYEENGNWQDFLAWQGLLKLLSTEECGLVAYKKGYQISKDAMTDRTKNSKAGTQNVLNGTGFCNPQYSKLRKIWAKEAGLRGASKWFGQKHTLEAKKKMSERKKEYYRKRNAGIV